jgi:broad specificity phosphatase PhoE
VIYLVRHGEAAASWGTHPNPGLSELGQDQARAVAKTLSSLDISQIYTSPMQRCQETSEPFAQFSGLSVTIEPCVTEIPTPPEIEDRIPWLRNLMSGTWDEAPTLVNDWRDALIETVSKLPSGTVVFSHFIAINAIVGYLEGHSKVTVFKPTYCSITKLEPTPNGLILLERGAEASTKVL